MICSNYGYYYSDSRINDNPFNVAEKKYAIRWIENDANLFRGRGFVGKNGNKVGVEDDPRKWYKLFDTKAAAEKYVKKHTINGMPWHFEVVEMNIKM